MRYVFPLLSLVVTVLSLAIDYVQVPHDSTVCAHGLCRFDQMAVSIDAQGLNSQNILTALAQSPADPLVWATYGELLSVEDTSDSAAAIYDHAVELGPHMAPVLMRTANFDFTNNRLDHGRLMAQQILAQTDAFDQILFSYLTSPPLPMSEVLDVAIPADPRAAKSWLSWLRSKGSQQDLLTTWNWMLRKNLADEQTAVELTRTLWDRHEYAAAQKVWVGWLGDRAGAYLKPERIWDPKFELEPTASPFDWAIDSPPLVRVERKDGLEIRFSGTENVSFSHVRQFVLVRPGRYRFSVEMTADGLTTDQLPLFHLFDPVHPAALSIETAPIGETPGRATIHLDFTVPSNTEVIQIQLERHPSERFANKIAGTLRVHSVKLLPL